MAKQDNYIGIAMGLDVTDLKAGLAETNRAITTAGKQFRATTSGMDNWKESTEGLNAKLEQLDTVLKNQKRQLAGYEAELKQTTEKFGENSEQARKLKDKILDVQSAIGRTEKDQRKYTAQLEKVESETKDTTKATDKLADAFDDADRSSIDFKGGLSTLKVAMGNLVSTAISSFVSGLKQAVEESREFRQEMGYLEATAQQTGTEFDHVKDKVKEVYALFGEEDSAVEGLNNLMQAGFEGDNLDKIVDELSAGAIAFKDTLKFEGLADGLQETLATGKAIGPFVELLERGGVVAEDFDEGLAKCTTEAEKQNYILDTLSKLGLSKAKTSYEDINKTLIESQEATFEYNEAQANLGETVEPVLTTIKQGWTNILNAFTEMMSGMDLEGLKSAISGAFQWFVDTGVPAIKGIIDWVVKHQDILIATIAGVVGGFLAWKAIGVATMIQGMIVKLITLIATQEGVTLAQKLMNLAMSANPIGIVITLIVALISAFVALWHKSDAFRNFWIGLWESIKNIAGKAWDAIVGFFTGAWEFITGIWGKAGSWFSGVIEDIVGFFSELPDKMLQIGEDMMNGLIEGVGNMIENVKKAVENAVDSAVEGVKDFLGIESPSKLMRDEVGLMMGEGVGEGLLDSTKGVVKKAKSFTASVTNGIKATTGNIGGQGAVGVGGATSVNNFNQTIIAPKQPSRLELYRQTKNLLAHRGMY